VPKHSKVGPRGLPFGATHDVEFLTVPQSNQDTGKPFHRFAQRAGVVSRRRLTSRSKKNLPAVLDLRGNDLPRYLPGPVVVREREMLCPTQEDVPPYPPFHPCLEATIPVEPNQAAPVVSAPLNQERRNRDLPKDYDTAQA
jgi:hypothetical protein